MTSIPLPSVTPHLFDYYLNHNEPFRINPIRFIAFCPLHDNTSAAGFVQTPPCSTSQLIMQGKLLQNILACSG